MQQDFSGRLYISLGRSQARINALVSHPLYPGKCAEISVQLLICLFSTNSSKYFKICMAAKDDFYLVHHKMIGFVHREDYKNRRHVNLLFIN